MVVARTQSQNAADIVAAGGHAHARRQELPDQQRGGSDRRSESSGDEQPGPQLVHYGSPGHGRGRRHLPGRQRAANQRFQAVFGQSPGVNEAYGVMRVTIISQCAADHLRAGAWHSVAERRAANATAVHRPRDVAVILDFSGSMAYCSLFSYPQSGTVTGSLNPDSFRASVPGRSTTRRHGPRSDNTGNTPGDLERLHAAHADAAGLLVC